MFSTRIVLLIGTLVWGVSMIGALFGLSRSLESRLFNDSQTQLAEANLKGFEIYISGQAVSLGLRPDGLETMGIRTPNDLNGATKAAQARILSLNTDLYGANHRATMLTGPITKLSFDEAALANARLKLEAPPSAQDIAVAASCTADVTQAVGKRKLNFVSDSAQLTPDSTAIITDIFTAIKACPERLELYVEGYTDNSGTPAHNLKLSQDRANAAANALIAKGLSADDVHVAGFGADKPMASNEDADGQAKNRRVEFTLKPR